MRIVAGRFKGRRLSAPKGMKTRPTTEKVREALFSLLGGVEGYRVADLFAGSGALGLEALSRGAAELVAVEMSAGALAVLKDNFRLLGLGREARALRRDLSRGFSFLDDLGPFDLILADPPYGRQWYEVIIRKMPLGALAQGGRLVVETGQGENRGMADPAGNLWNVQTKRKYGQTEISILTPEIL